MRAWFRSFPFFRHLIVSDGWGASILWGLPVATLGYLLGLWLERPSHQYSLFDHISYVGMAAIFIVLYGLLLSRAWSTTRTVMTIIVVVYSQFIAKLVYLLYFNPHPTRAQAEFTETFFWIPALFVLSAFIPGLKRGRLVVGLFFTLFSAVSVLYSVPNWLAGENIGIIYALLQMLLANVTLLTLTHNFLGFKEHLTRTHARAQMMERLAYQDTLTDLPNRLALELQLEQLIGQRRSNERVALAFIDIDGFKLINDSYGHAVGDALLREVAFRLNRTKRTGDIVFRISGDEFVVVFSALPRDIQSHKVGERIRSSFVQPFILAGQVFRISVSIGIACSPDDGTVPATLLKHADAAMYTVKHRGKDGFAHYDAQRDEPFEDRLRLSHDLKEALQSDALELYYQPIVEVATNRCVRVEALMRWHHPTRGEVQPATFIALAEENGLITQLGRYALKAACARVAIWRSQGLGDIVVSVNVSAQQLRDPEFASRVREILTVTGVPPACLELELTESSIFYAREQVTSTLKALRLLGVAIALDDFGTGYSSLSYLETLDFDTIKLDRSFAPKLVATRKSPQYAVAIIRAVLKIAATLDVAVVAEGIETREQLELFRALGCPFLQGFYLGKPLPGDEIVGLLQKPCLSVEMKGSHPSHTN